MKKAMFVWFVLFPLAFSTAGGKKDDGGPVPAEKRTVLVIINNTSEEIKEVILYREGYSNDVRQQCRMKKGEYLTVDIYRGEYYNLTLVDTKGHSYIKEKCRWVNMAEEVTITDQDFVSKGFWDGLKKFFGL